MISVRPTVLKAVKPEVSTSHEVLLVKGLSSRYLCRYGDRLNEIKDYLVALLEKETPANYKVKTILIKRNQW
jgi:hypothetical protein